MFDKEQIITIIKNDSSYLRTFHLKSIGLFGSVARSESTAASDVDFLVEYDSGYKSWTNFNKTCDYFEKYFGNNYDIITREGISDRMFTTISKDIIYVQLND